MPSCLIIRLFQDILVLIPRMNCLAAPLRRDLRYAPTICEGLTLAFFIPITTIISFHSCDFFVKHIERDLDGQLNNILSDWESFKKDISLKKVRDSIRSAGAFVKELSLKLTRILIEYTCLIIIKYFFFPIIIACGFYIVLKSTLTKSFDTKLLRFIQSGILRKVI